MIQISEHEIMKNWDPQDNNILVSCCCVTYNHEKYIGDALDSMLMQKTNFPFEIIVRDDCSTDNTASIIKKYMEKFPTIIKPILEKENQYSKGLRPSRPVFEMAQGKYLAILEGDDYWTDPLKLQKQIDILEDNPEISLVFHNAMIHEYDENDNIINIRKHNEDLSTGYISVLNCIEKKIVPTGSVVLRNIDLNSFLQDNFPVGDTPMFMYLGKFGKLYYVNEMTSIYRLLTTGAVKSQLRTIKMNIAFIPYYKVLKKEFSEFQVSDTIDNLIIRRYKIIIKLALRQANIKCAIKYTVLLSFYQSLIFIKNKKADHND